MITLRPRASLHHVEGGWFSANWHFSFDTYADPDNTWFGDLRVFNDDRLVPGAIWPMHPHRDIEGITYVAEGMFEHARQPRERRDPPAGLGPAGDARLGHAALGRQPLPDRADALHPDVDHPAERGLEPSVEQHSFGDAERRGGWLPVLVPADGYGAPMPRRTPTP